MVDLFITPSIVQQFYLKPEWGVKAYYNTIYNLKSEDNHFIKRGRMLHETLGYNNDVRFFRTKVVTIDGEDYVVAVEGTPDAIEPDVKELKTTVKNNWNDVHKIIEAASLQLQGYLFLLERNYGFVVVHHSKKDYEIVDVLVTRDDERFFSWVAKFFKYLWSQKSLDSF